MQRQLENAPRAVVADLAVRQRCPERIAVARAARSSNELADPVRIGNAGGALLPEPLVVVLVAVQDDICVSVVEVLPERLEVRLAAVNGPGREARFVPIRQDASVRMCCEVVSEPGFFRGAGVGG